MNSNQKGANLGAMQEKTPLDATAQSDGYGASTESGTQKDGQTVHRTRIARARGDWNPAERVEVATMLCEMIAEGKSLTEACNRNDMPTRGTFLKWCHDNEAIGRMYTTAIRMRAAWMAEELESLCKELEQPGITSERISALKVIINTKQWAMTRLLPKWYGDHQVVEHTGAAPQMTREQIDARLKALLAKVKWPAAPDSSGGQS